MMGFARYGDTVGPFGYQVSVLSKGGDGYRDHNDFDLADLTAKFRWYFTPRTNITVKLNYYGGERTILKRDAMLVRIEADNGLVGYGPVEGGDVLGDCDPAI